MIPVSTEDVRKYAPEDDAAVSHESLASPLLAGTTSPDPFAGDGHGIEEGTPLAREKSFGRRFSSAQVSFHGDVLHLAGVKERKKFRKTTALVLLFLVVVLLIPLFCIPEIIGKYPEIIEKYDRSPNYFLPVVVGAILTLPVALFLKWCKHELKKSVGYFALILDDDHEEKTCWQIFLKIVIPRMSEICIALAIMFRQGQDRLIIQVLVPETYQGMYGFLMNQAAAMFAFAGYISFLDEFHGAFFSYAKRMDSIAADNKNSRKWFNRMKTYCTYEDEEKNRGYAIPGGNRSAPCVLAEIVGVYCNIGKMAGFVMLLIFYLSLDLSSSLIALVFTVVFAGVVHAFQLNEAFTNLLSLAMSNAVHVGEIVSLSKGGGPPGDDPSAASTGFIEGFTWGHVIIRDFRRKQIFVGHDTFRKMTLHNWTRRQNNHAYFKIRVVPELSGGADRLAKLATFSMDWIKAHPDIDQDQYKKSAVNYRETGVFLQVIFYPVIVTNAHRLRAEFSVMILDLARRLNLCLMPAEVRRSFPWENDDENLVKYGEDMDFSDLLPCSDLTLRAGYKPKEE